MSPKSQSLCLALSLLGILDFLIFSEATTVDLIHRDSPLSPIYDPSITHFDRLHNDFQRSLNRLNSFKLSLGNHNRGNARAPVKLYKGGYFMKYSIGTPPVQITGFIDTGSSLIWTQCLPCIHCFKQDTPVFNPRNSTSYNKLPCQSPFCSSRYVEDPKCDQNGTCHYYYHYFDHSHTAGDLATETLTIGAQNLITSPKTVFGCAHDSAGSFTAAASGLIGLGRGKLSLVSQLGIKKLSYCLSPYINVTSKIVFGENSVFSGADVVTTPFLTIPSAFYRVTLEAISVGSKRIEYVSENQKGGTEGNVAIDSGTTYTFLPHSLYDGLVSAVDKIIKDPQVADPYGIFKHCYKVGEPDKIVFPLITAHFKGADVTLMAINIFLWQKEDVVCLGVFPSDVGFFGNIAQNNFWVGYDLEAGTVSFKPADCSK